MTHDLIGHQFTGISNSQLKFKWSCGVMNMINININLAVSQNLSNENRWQDKNTLAIKTLRDQNT